MNTIEKAILLEIEKSKYINQRELAERLNCSLGIVNRSIKNLQKSDFLDEDCRLTGNAIKEIEMNSPRNAIILAAGFGMRMVPINMEIPKALLEIDQEPLIERLIKQLHEVGINEIHIVVGFLKEQFEYLIDEYNVHLIYNKDYSKKNNLHSLLLAERYISNTYIVPCDIWCHKNPFNASEMYSWYMVNELKDEKSTVRMNRKRELVAVSESDYGNKMIGIAYLADSEAQRLRRKLMEMGGERRFDNSFWEDALFGKDGITIQAKGVSSHEVIELNTYEQLRELDDGSSSLKSDAIDAIINTFQCRKDEITDISVLKKGMTNRSFLFKCRDKRYIMRVPGEGTDKLIDRRKEAIVYDTVSQKDICDNVAYLNPENGYKITEYFENVRVCDSKNRDDLVMCMMKLRDLHEQNLAVDFEFDIWENIEFYETLWNGEKSIYRDYERTKSKVKELSSFIEANVEKKVLTHIDAVPDNFLFVPNNGVEEVRLIDWEYAGMQDPHIDIAMFCIYSMYSREQVDELIDIYFEGECQWNIRIKIYCYIAACGLLWSNWCEYKRMLGVEFGEYSLRQYRYAKEYYKIVMDERGKYNA